MFPFGLVFVAVTFLIALKFWLDYCLEIDQRHKDDLVHARSLIAAAGRCFPLRSRAGSGALGALLSSREEVDGRSSIRPGRRCETRGETIRRTVAETGVSADS
jgi:hypothetical protein